MQVSGGESKVWVFVAAACVILIWSFAPALVGFSLKYLGSSVSGNEISVRGQFGDQFGVVNALFTGLALIGLIFSAFQNHEMLSIAREELKTARNELKAAQDGLEEQRQLTSDQNKRLQEQQFDQTFFNLLGGLEATRNSVRIEFIGSRRQEFTGMEAIQRFGRKVDELLKSHSEFETEVPRHFLKEQISENIFKSTGNGLSIFVDQATVLIRFAHQNGQNRGSIYVQVLRSTFSISEQKILAAAAISRKECDDLLGVAKDFSLFTGLAYLSEQHNYYRPFLPIQSLTLDSLD